MKCSLGPSWTVSREFSSASASARVRVTGGEPLVRHGVEDFIGAACRARRRGSVDHDERPSACRPYRSPRRRRPAAREYQPGFARSRKIRENHAHKIVRRGDARYRRRAGVSTSRLRKSTPCSCAGSTTMKSKAFAEFARERGLVMRFIEFMPLDADRHWNRDLVVPAAEIHQRIHARWPLVADSARAKRNRAQISIRRWRSRRNRPDRSCDAAVLRPLLAHPAHCRRQAAHVSFQQGRSRLQRIAPRRRER